jgi:methionyl aminopeptidase
LNATYPVGKIDKESADLIATTKKAMEEAIGICKPGVAYRDIGNKIEEITKPKGMSIVRRYTAHGIHQLVSAERNPDVGRLTVVSRRADDCALRWKQNAGTYGGRSGVHHRGSVLELARVTLILQEPMINLGTANLGEFADCSLFRLADDRLP